MTRTLLAAAAIACAFAAPALAAPASAQLRSPVASPTQVIAGGAVWTCAGQTCSTGSASDRTLDVGGCHELARAVGPVAGYATFDAGALARCDKGVKDAAPVVADKAAEPRVASR